jgi:hypothetical protein
VFGSLPKVPRPILLILVYGSSSSWSGSPRPAQSLLVGSHFSTSTLNAIVGSDAATTRAFVNAYVLPRYLDPAQARRPRRCSRLRGQLASLTRQSEIVRVELRRPDGGLVASSDAVRRRR